MNRLYQKPALFLLAGEGRALPELAATMLFGSRIATRCAGDGHPVLVIPGFGGTDFSTTPLRNFLNEAGFSAHPWDLGRNLGGRKGLKKELIGRIQTLSNQYGTTVSLVGWSMGGIFSRRLAVYSPEGIRQVITLGSPFFATAEETHVGWLAKKSPMKGRAQEGAEHSPKVPVTSLFTTSDGIVPWESCLQETSPLTENIRVLGSHCGLAHNPTVLYLIAQRLNQPEGQWTPFEATGSEKLLFKSCPYP
jgi:hypothetical protein